MPTTLLTLQAGNLPTGYCWPASPQTLINDALAISSAVFGGEFQTFNFGSTIPAAANRGFPWIRTVNGKFDRLYVFDSSYWLSPHPVPASSSYRAMWVGTTDDLENFDGGADEAISNPLFFGPMWEVDADFAGRSPMHPGLLSTTNTNITVGFNHGAETVTLTADQMPVHTHSIANVRTGDTNNNASGSGTGQGVVHTDINGVTGSAGGGNYHSIVHPIRGIYIIKRTARVHYRQSA